MSDFQLALCSFPVVLGLIFIRVPIALAMFLVGAIGYWIIFGNLNPILSRLEQETYSTFSNYSLSIIPLFLLMGQFATLGGMSQSLFKAAETCLGHRRGGVAISAIGACAGFGAICGSSLATAATMGQVALPELRKYGYSNALATGTLAAGGTLGVLIPPSIVLVLYAILAEQNIAKLFLAALIPGIMAAMGYILVINIYVRLFPDAAGVRPRAPWAERLEALVRVWPVLVLFLVVVGGIYLGWFTPTEGAAVGAVGAGLVAFFSGGLSWATLKSAIISTAASTAMIYFIVFGAAFYNSFLALAQLPQISSAWVVGQGFSPWLVLTIILVSYLVLGCVMDSLSMIMLTVPIFLPIVSGLDFGLTPEEFAIWFGILVLVVVEVGLITPPVGMNLFVINAMAKDIPMAATYKGVFPFVVSDVVRVVILVLVPSVALGLLRLTA